MTSFVMKIGHIPVNRAGEYGIWTGNSGMNERPAAGANGVSAFYEKCTQFAGFFGAHLTSQDQAQLSSAQGAVV